MPSHKRQTLVLVLLMGIAALVAQVAGVGGSRSAPRGATVGKPLAVIPGGSVPDLGSTTLASAKRTATKDEVVQMHGDASLVSRRLGTAGIAQVVCGLRYSRDGDPAWTLGTPYETIVLTRGRASDHVKIERSFTAPADDTYRVSVACHLSSPAKGAKVTATGSTRFALGLPEGAATPVS
jgi:hypothetical protein